MPSSSLRHSRSLAASGLLTTFAALTLATALPSARADDRAPAVAAPLTRAQVQADLRLYRESGLAALERTEPEAPVESPALNAARARYHQLRMDLLGQDHPLTRAEVLTDLRNYRESGLPSLERSDGEQASPDSAARQAAQQRYAALTQGHRDAGVR